MTFSALALVPSVVTHTGDFVSTVSGLSGVDWMRISTMVAVAVVFSAVVWGRCGLVLGGLAGAALAAGYVYLLSLPGGGWALGS